MSRDQTPLISHLGLLVIDVQASFLKAFSAPDPFVKRVKFCVETARLFNLPTLFTEQRPEVLGGTIEEVKKLNPTAPVCAKTGFSAFSERAVEQWLETESIEHILMSGLETPICVYQTVLDAIHRDYAVSLVSDAVGCRRVEDAAFVLESLRAQGVHILPGETIFYSILADSTHACFKEFTHLVKKYSDK